VNGVGGGANELCFNTGVVLCYCKDIHSTEESSYFLRNLLHVNPVARNIEDETCSPLVDLCFMLCSRFL
jgi:hypothetical protein